MFGILKKCINVLNSKERRLDFFTEIGFYDKWSDEDYIKLKYKVKMKKDLNLIEPTTYNEKLQWLKLNDHNPEYVKLVDKYEVKDYVAKLIGQQYIIPTLGIWDSVEDINFDELPEQFVLKCTHDSGGLVICKNKAELDIADAKRIISKCLKRNFYKYGREWPYKDVAPRIIAEKYMEDASTGELSDYKFFVFNGKVKALFVATERQKVGEDVKFDFFDEQYNHLPIKQGHENALIPPQKPVCFNEMIALAEKLGKNLKQVRVDFYEVNGKVYFGELTFYHHGGWTPFEPEKWDYKFGEWIELGGTE